MDLWALFSSAFLSSTLLPGGSEIVLSLLAANTETSRIMLITTATLGNTLGGMTSLFIGYKIPNRLIQESKQQQAISMINRWGYPALLFSWLPFIGDPLCLAAGWLRLPLFGSILFITIGKLLRYIAIVYLASPILNLI